MEELELFLLKNVAKLRTAMILRPVGNGLQVSLVAFQCICF